MARALFAALCISIIAGAGSLSAEVATHEITRSTQPHARIKFTLAVEPRHAFHCKKFRLSVPPNQPALNQWTRTILEIRSGGKLLVYAPLQPTADKREDGAKLVEFTIGNDLIAGAVLHLVTDVGESESQIWYDIQLGTYVELDETQSKESPSASALPVGRWQVEFANGVVQTCEIRRDAAASATEPQRTSGGRATSEKGAIIIAFDDDRVERWTPVGPRMVVEHWYPRPISVSSRNGNPRPL